MTTVGVPGDPNLDAVQSAFAALGDLRESVVLVGGCATGLLVTATRSEMIRPTRDVDLVVEVVSARNFRRAEQRLRARGFLNDQSAEAPICRWRHGEIIVDLMPMSADVLGFGNRWYPRAVELADRVALPDGQSIRLVSAPVLLVTKFDAFRSRAAPTSSCANAVDGRQRVASRIQSGQAGAVTARSRGRGYCQPIHAASAPTIRPATAEDTGAHCA